MFEQFDGNEILKVWGSVEGKMVEQGEDVWEDEELRKTEISVAIGLGYRTISRDFDTIPPLVGWWSRLFVCLCERVSSVQSSIPQKLST